ncbi:unnamed protein product [Vitrella brassicaformis CCMP3155]|uniref:Uncharacterized protein n=1 Tax=Vitrella brassicaformis (strain CCMP3155) TaxID=1169540 RepID=A0A0G4EUV9_VITBC|nr:unnamed protein product [Vitrella brassicaformis CCMP3155]|eukprot:CEM02385.1 unnamed protein product [Vitrella brassicaformis CCMP3155]
MDKELAKFDKMSKDVLVDKILEMQDTLAALTLRVDSVKSENHTLREENGVLREYVDNLMAKVGTMSSLGTAPPSAVKVPPSTKRDSQAAAVHGRRATSGESTHAVRVNDHIGELATSYDS